MLTPFLRALIVVNQHSEKSLARAWIRERQPKIRRIKEEIEMERVIILCMLSSLTVITHAHEGAEGVIKDRMDRFKANKESMKSIKGNLGSDASLIAKEALAIQDWANQMTDFFPRRFNAVSIGSTACDLGEFWGLQSARRCQCQRCW
jgi:hypothetical protein